MLRPRVIPALLLKGRGLYKTTKFSDPVYLGDPVNTVRIFNEKEVDELAVLDIGVTASCSEPNYELLAELASEAFMPISYGGSIRSVEQVRRILSLGVEKVLINTAFHGAPELVTQIASYAGSSAVAVSIDVRKKLFGGYEVYVDAGKRATGREVVEYAKQAQEAGAGELLLNAIDRDGMMKGFDLSLIEAVSAAVSVPVIACGGAGCFADLQAAIKHGASAVAAGSMFVFHGRHRAVLISYPNPLQIESLSS